jgi:hypothetical protein
MRSSLRRIGFAPELAIWLLVAIVATVALAATHHRPATVLPQRSAVQAALTRPQIQQAIQGAHWRAESTPVDSNLDRVSFFAGGRILAEAAVQRNRQVAEVIDFAGLAVPYGSWIAYEPGLLVALSAVFLAVVGVAPWRRLRNLDALAVLSLLAPVVLLQYRYLAASVLASLPGLMYLLARCAWRAFGPQQRQQAATPLIEALMPSLDAARRVRFLRLLAAAIVLAYVMVGISSGGAVDVIFAVMEGATKLVHGVLPYGHMPGDVVHGDTYPILSYVLFAPLAWIAPVHTTWDSVDGALAVTVAAALCTAWGLWRFTRGALGRATRSWQPGAEEAGLRAALAWLAFPPLLVTVSTGTTDVPLAAMLFGAVLLWRRPALSTGLLTAAGWFKLAPFALMPIWLAPLRGRRLLGAAAAVLAVSAPLIALLIVIGGLRGPAEMVHALSYQFSRGSPQSLWDVLGIRGLQPLAEGCVLGLIASGALKLRRDPEWGQDLTRVAALAGAVLIGLQLAADYWAFLYVCWVLPLLCISVLGSTGTTAATVKSISIPDVSPVPSPVAG